MVASCAQTSALLVIFENVLPAMTWVLPSTRCTRVSKPPVSLHAPPGAALVMVLPVLVLAVLLEVTRVVLLVGNILVPQCAKAEVKPGTMHVIASLSAHTSTPFSSAPQQRNAPAMLHGVAVSFLR